MGGPWEKYQKQEEGPWTKYQSSAFSTASDKGRHLSFEEGQALLEQERMQGLSGETGAGLSSTIDSIPVAGPYILGGVQRAAAGLSSLINGDSYDENLERAKDLTNTAQAENPIVSTAGRVAGSVLGTAPMVAAMPGAFGIGAGSLATRMAASSLSGAALGGADAAVRSDGDLWETGKGALFGGTLGTLGPLIGDKVSQAYRAWAGNRATADAARQAGTSKEAVDVVARSLGADDATNAVNANIHAAGSRAMLADAGPSTQSILDTAIQRAGPGAGRASERIAARAAGATDDINNALDAALGTPQGMMRPLEELRTSTQPARAAAYDAAYAQPINYADPRAQMLEKIIKGRVPPSIISRANNLMRINGEESQQILAKVADDGTVAFERLPDVRQLDYIKRALNDVARAGDGAGALGGNTAEGAAYGNLAKTIRDALSALVPEYRTAMKTAAEPIAQREATLFGQRMLSPSVARDEVEAFVSGLSDAELRSLRSGVRSKMDEVLANVKRAVSDGKYRRAAGNCGAAGPVERCSPSENRDYPLPSGRRQVHQERGRGCQVV